jgi:hypothetical protein
LTLPERAKYLLRSPSPLEDTRRDYDETRYISVGLLDLRAVILVWTPRGKARRIISMRYANDREKEKYSKHLD